MGQLLLRKNSAESVTNKGPLANNIHKDKADDDDDSNNFKNNLCCSF